MFRIIVGLLGVFVVNCNAQTIKQCTCREIEPCRKGYLNSFIPCADKCAKYVTALGADYTKVRQCLVSRKEKIRQIRQCIEDSFPNACTNGTRKMLKKRYPETLRIAAVARINAMFQRSGALQDLKPLLATGQKFLGCSRSCMDKSTHQCAKNAKCQLDLPSDDDLINTSVRCARQNGVNSQSLQQLCNCFADAGILQLAKICPKIQFM